MIEGGKIEDGHAAVFNAFGDMKLINKGKIKGDVSGTTGDENTITNTGKIKGDVGLGTGDDELDNRDGTITGYIWGGAGKDRLIAGDKKEKFVFTDQTDFDRVKNFESGKDKFFLDQATFPGLPSGRWPSPPFAGAPKPKTTTTASSTTRTAASCTSTTVSTATPPIQFAKVDPGQKLKYTDFTVEVFA